MSADREPLTELESALRALQPRSLETSRDQLMYRAGRASMKHYSWTKGISTSVLGLVVGIGATFLALRSHLGAEKTIVIVKWMEAETKKPDERERPEEAAPKNPSMPEQKIEVTHKMPSDMSPSMTPFLSYPDGGMTSSDSYLGLRNQVLRWGVDVIPLSPGSSAPFGRSEPWSALEMYGKNKAEPLEF